jgi:hypothetical protein
VVRSEGPPESRRIAARRRSRTAKRWIVAIAAVGFGATMALARVTYAGHPKRGAGSLAIPQPLYQAVRQNLLQAGVLAPTTAPPDATTSTS